MRKFSVEKEYKGYTISRYLREVQEYSGRSIRNLIFYLDGKRVKSTKKLRQYNKLLVYEKEKGTDIKGIQLDLDIVYEDQDLLVLNKPPYMVVHPTLKKTDFTLANGIVYYFETISNLSVVPRFYNRLDMNTSGLIIVTKNAYAQAYLQEKCEVKKYYKAIVEGIVEKDEFIVEKPIGRIGDSLQRQILLVESGGQYSKTAFKVLKRFKDKNITLVECELFTGRTHQIRVHLSSEEHPIVGDELYNGPVNDFYKRQMLHAYKVELVNPKTKNNQLLEIDLPSDMKLLLEEG
jgi:23S rRNA pseudouridine1911/1915/1917 synthase